MSRARPGHRNHRARSGGDRRGARRRPRPVPTGGAGARLALALRADSNPLTSSGETCARASTPVSPCRPDRRARLAVGGGAQGARRPSARRSARKHGYSRCSRSFTLRTLLDRIEHHGLHGLDYKTGAPPKSRQVSPGLSPQLTLEARFCRRAVRAFWRARRCWVLSTSGCAAATCPGYQGRSSSRKHPDAKSDEALAKLTTVVTRNEGGYLPKKADVHAARRRRLRSPPRVREWSLTGGEAGTGDVE